MRKKHLTPPMWGRRASTRRKETRKKNKQKKRRGKGATDKAKPRTRTRAVNPFAGDEEQNRKQNK